VLIQQTSRFRAEIIFDREQLAGRLSSPGALPYCVISHNTLWLLLPPTRGGAKDMSLAIDRNAAVRRVAIVAADEACRSVKVQPTFLGVSLNTDPRPRAPLSTVVR
jgi:hypothetical protein